MKVALEEEVNKVYYFISTKNKEEIEYKKNENYWSVKEILGTFN